LVVALAYTSYLKNEPEVWVLWTVFVLILLHFLFVSFVVKFLTPIYFGFLAFGRLKKIEHWAKPGPITFASFVEVPSGNELHVNIMGVWPVRGTVGTTYLLLRHPSNVKIVLPILDDDPIYRSHVLNLATARRRQEIEMQLQKLRS
jgi:hypothetical protein